jgi:hypothetical protein
MALVTCPECAAHIADQATVCPVCGKAVKSKPAEVAPIHRVDGKLQAIGTVLLASGVIATVAGGWWGPALLFPGMVIFIIGRFW